MDDDREYTPLSQALKVLGELRVRSATERVGLRDAFGRILAEEIRSREDVPRFDSSHFDGYAVASSETLRASRDSPVTIVLMKAVAGPGKPRPPNLAKGRAMRVLTGAYLPRGADAVVAREDVEERPGAVSVKQPVDAGEHVYPAGADAGKGDLLFEPGKTIVGQDLVLLTSLRVGGVRVFRRPRVTIIPTGSELARNPNDASGKVVESHSVLLERLIDGAGGLPKTYPIVGDDKSAISRSIARALRESDVVLTLAGSSVGEPDLVEGAIRAFGKANSRLVHGLRVNRGRVMGFAVVGGRPIVILPGPIQGALNAFIVMGYPLIRRHLGRGMEEPPALAATMENDWEASGRYRDFDQVVYLTVRPAAEGTPRLMASASGAATEKMSFLVGKNAYAMVPGTRPRLSKGEQVWARLLPGFSWLG